MAFLAQAYDPGGAVVVYGLLGILVYGVGLVLAIAWLILPFMLMSKMKRTISLLESQYELAFRDAKQQAQIAEQLQLVIAQLERISGEPSGPPEDGQ